MRWLPYTILAYVMLGVQIGAGGFLRWHEATPNLVLPVVVFIALNAPRDEALLGAFMVGAMQDLVTLQPLGLYAFCYGLIALFITGVAPLVSRGHPLTHVSLSFVVAILTAVLMYVHGWIHPPGAAVPEGATAAAPAIRLSLGPLLKSAVFTAAVAPLPLGVMHQLSGLFGFVSAGRRKRY